MSDIFCKIISGEIPAEKVAEGDSWIAINDIRPKAPVHVLVIPRKHIVSVADLTDNEINLAGELMFASKKIAEMKGIDKTGFRVIINHGEHGGQEVPHLHLHVLGGKKL